MAKMCQSCSMPLKRDPKGGGTEADGSPSSLYCSYCYQDGHFLQPDLDATQMQQFCIEQMRKNGMPKIFAWLFTRGIPKLSRWQKFSS